MQGFMQASAGENDYEVTMLSSLGSAKDILFKDKLFKDTLELIKGRNKTRVIRDIIQLIIPPAKILAIYSTKYLKIFKETTNAS